MGGRAVELGGSDGSGSGSGSGYGSGYGYGSDGSGSGAGCGYGDGSGSGYGFGSGSGSGSGYGFGSGFGDIVRAVPTVVRVTAPMLRAREACAEGVWAFEAAFPDGAVWPDDIPAAEAEGLDLTWAQQVFGLIRPCGAEAAER